MPDIGEIFRDYGPQYKKNHPNLYPSHKRAIDDISNCRTQELGFHIDICAHCGYKHEFYHSCCNRSCPKCHGGRTHKWLEKNIPQLLPLNYFHVVFTLPAQLRPFVFSNQQVLYDCLFKAAAYTLSKLLADPKFAGGVPGMLAVLHTWSNPMNFHPRVHFLLPEVVLYQNRTKWKKIKKKKSRDNKKKKKIKKKKFLVPIKMLSQIFRARYMKLARKALPDIEFPQTVWKKQWVVYPKYVDYGGQKVLEYLARYIYRVAITNHRIVAYKDKKVTFKYKDSKTNTWDVMELEVDEFMRRFLQHVLPQGFHKVRTYGFMVPQNKSVLQSLKLELVKSTRNTPKKSIPNRPYKNFRRCPRCKRATMVVTLHIFHTKNGLILVRPPP
ncbi:MAG: transposase [bacterium]|nr:transposase [bacterium]